MRILLEEDVWGRGSIHKERRRLGILESPPNCELCLHGNLTGWWAAQSFQSDIPKKATAAGVIRRIPPEHQRNSFI
jgi:hypothetical protein